jgi:hypothetical protein
MTQYKLVQVVDGRLIATEFSENNVYSAMEVRGFTYKAVNINKGHREELQNQPIFEGVIGPMYDGPGCIRYETRETYEILSN